MLDRYNRIGGSGITSCHQSNCVVVRWLLVAAISKCPAAFGGTSVAGLFNLDAAPAIALKDEMMKTSAIIEGLMILSKYWDDDGYHCGGEHDAIWADKTPRPLDLNDVRRLIDLGWFQEDADCDDEDFAAKHYDADTGWNCFT